MVRGRETGGSALAGFEEPGRSGAGEEKAGGGKEMADGSEGAVNFLHR